MKSCAILLFSLLSFGCHMNKENIAIDWREGDSLPDVDNHKHIGVAGPVTGIIGSRLVIAGGANFPDAMPWDGGKKQYQKDAYIYDLNTENELKYLGRQEFNDSLAYSANISLGDQFISVGGERNGQAIADVLIYQFENDRLIRQNLVYPDLPIPLTNGAVTYFNNTLYFVGGENIDLVSNKMYALDLSEPNSSWVEFIELPKALSHTILVNDKEGNLYVIGGRKRNTNAKSDIFSDVYKIDIKTKSIQSLEQLPEQLAAGTGIFYEGNIVVIGGDNGSTFHKVEQLIVDSNLSENEEIKDKLIQQKNDIQRAHPGFGKNVWVMNLKEGKWKAVDSIIGESPVTTTAILYKNSILIPSGEVKAGVRTNQILMGKIK